MATSPAPHCAPPVVEFFNIDSDVLYVKNSQYLMKAKSGCVVAEILKKCLYYFLKSTRIKALYCAECITDTDQSIAAVNDDNDTHLEPWGGAGRVMVQWPPSFPATPPCMVQAAVSSSLVMLMSSCVMFLLHCLKTETVKISMK